jgi:multisubunit Na+/H+ antiporter MnhB subunit
MSDNEPVRLTEQEKHFGEIQEEKARAEIRSIDADTSTRLWVAGVITLLFVGLNAAVITLVWHAFAADIELLKSKMIQNNQRLITENVFMSLVGATVVQVGVTLVAITGYLFPKKNNSQ